MWSLSNNSDFHHSTSLFGFGFAFYFGVGGQFVFGFLAKVGEGESCIFCFFSAILDI